MVSRTFIVGTRGSPLALRQADIALAALRATDPAAGIAVRTIRTEGDRTAASLSEIGGRGVFVIEIERTLLAGEIDIAVHSLKDLPSDETPGLTIAAVLERADARDVLISRNGRRLQDLSPEAVVGTGSPRRAAQLLALRADLRLVDIRGNVNTRIAKVLSGDYDAVVLAAAGLARLGSLDRATQIFEPAEMLPAVGQGALAVQVRSDDLETQALVRAADDADTRMAITAERAFERRLGGGCHAAIAAYGELLRSGSRQMPLPAHGDPEHGRRVESMSGATTLRLRGLVGDASGNLMRGEIEGPALDAETLGVQLAKKLLARGAGVLLEAPA